VNSPSNRASWLASDLTLVSAFAVIGRLSHAEGLTLSGWWHTAWPFLAGLLVGWAVIGRRSDGPSRAGSVAAGLVVWPSTVVLGMILRRLSDQGTALSFTVVATIVVGLMLLGSRAAAALTRRFRG
jgi:Protein of unknown function (DUF3054)